MTHAKHGGKALKRMNPKRLKHIQGPECPKCDDTLKTAHETLRELFYKLKPKNQDMHVSWAWRGEKDQKQFYAEGKSRTPWPLSKHNTFDDQGNPCSLAIDIFELCSNGMARWAWDWFRNIADQIKAMGAPIAWGGDFKRFPDAPHFELNSRNLD